MTSRPLLGIDVGGTTVKARLVDGGRTLEEWRRPTPAGDRSGAATIDVIADLVARASAISPVAAVGVAVPGIVDDDTGICVSAINLGWDQVPLRDLIVQRIDIPLAFGQDVRAGALAEGVSGAAAGFTGTYAFVPIGTGLASAIGANGVVAPASEWLGEIGQLVITRGPHAGKRVEQIASASGIAREADAPDALSVARLVRAHDPAATTIWNDAIELLAESIIGVITGAGAELIVVGGGLAEAGSLLLDPLGDSIRRQHPAASTVTLRQAVHGDAAAVVGTVIMAERLLEGR